MISSFLYSLNHAACWRGEMKVWDRRMGAASLDRLVYLGLHRSGLMGKDEARLLRNLIRPGMRIVDVGANVGLYSLLMARRTGDQGSVVAFEPEPNLFAILVANCTRNGAHNVTALSQALGAANGPAVFQRSAFNSGDNRLGGHSSAHEPLEVKVVRFDDIQPETSPDFIKIDVQGHELDVLRGMEGALARNHDVRVLFEFCPSASRAAGSSAEELLGFLRDRDFLLYETAGGEPQPANDLGQLISNTSGRRYFNLLASREPLNV
jgi:FkbM family methyltransferase